MSSEMNDQLRLDEVSVFGGKLRFLIPHDWVEAESEADHYLYHLPETKSGWMRVSLITLTTNTPREHLPKLFSERESFFISEKMRNMVEVSDKASEEQATPIHIYYWKVGNTVLPDRVYEAVFSYTIRAETMHDQATQEMVELIENLVSEAVFGYGLQ